MLDLFSLSEQINEKKEIIAKYEQELKSNIKNVFEFLKSINEREIQGILAKIPSKDEKNEILFCLPYYGNYSEFLKTYSCNLNYEYEIFAVDGSNTEIERHNLTPYYVLNIASVSISYGEKESKFFYKTFPYIYFDQDIYSDKDTVTFKSSYEISQERQQREFNAILEYIENSPQKDERRIVLYDGNLIDWSQDRQGVRFGRRANPALEKIFLLAEKKRIAVCGFISTPKNSIISNIYRIRMCENSKIACGECPNEKKRECEKFGRIKDVILFSDLKEGEYSNIFYTLGRAFDEFEETDVGFVYLNTGYEIARIEFPLYIANDKDWFEVCLGAIYHQCQLGFGYPISLTHAHQFSVISKEDKEVIENLLYSAEDGLIRYSAKKNNKIKRII